MPQGFDLIHLSEAAFVDGYRVATCTVSGAARSRAANPEASRLWAVEAELDDGAVIEWPKPHGEEVLFVRSGEIAVAGWLVPAGGVAVVERAARPRVEVRGPTTLLHFGSTGPTNGAGTDVHVIGPRGMAAQVHDLPDGTLRSQYFVDSTCASCSPTLLRVDVDHGTRLPSHSHSADELIVLLAGDLRLGGHELAPGDVLRLAAEMRYVLVSERGFSFLNFRREISSISVERRPPELEYAGSGYQRVAAHLRPARSPVNEKTTA